MVTYWGRLIGNHHIGVGHARYVDCLKGVNCIGTTYAALLPCQATYVALVPRCIMK